MTESDYSIKPLQNLSNAAGMNVIRDGDARNERQGLRKRPQREGKPVDDEQKETKHQEIEMMIDNTSDGGIDYRA